jgi:hypothetical protein
MVLVSPFHGSTSIPLTFATASLAPSSFSLSFATRAVKMYAAGAIFIANATACVPCPSQSSKSAESSTQSFQHLIRLLRAGEWKNIASRSQPVSNTAILIGVGRSELWRNSLKPEMSKYYGQISSHRAFHHVGMWTSISVPEKGNTLGRRTPVTGTKVTTAHWGVYAADRGPLVP